MIDPVSDMMTRIRNAGMARHASTRVPYSIMKDRVSKILKEEGYISEVETVGEAIEKQLIVHLKYDDNHNMAIKRMKKVSKSGCRVYAGVKEIPLVNQGLGISILSTSKGIITDKEARRQNVGGEVLCEIW